MISNIEQDYSVRIGLLDQSHCSLDKVFASRSIPLWYDNTMEALLSIRCYMCNGLLSGNFDPIIIRKTGRKIFRIETRCSECKRIKSKKFCDTFNKLPHEMYQLIQNKIYIDYTPSGIKFTDLSKTVQRE